MDYLIGIDSGGTNYRVQAEDLTGNILGQYVGNSASHYALPEDEVIRRINHHIDECLAIFGGDRQDCRYLICGTTGLDTDEDSMYLNNLYQNLRRFDCPMVVKNDAEIAHYAVVGGIGILVISGTGSIAFGVNRKGESRKVGGWPLSIMGEEGSGTWVTRKAIRYVADCYDGVSSETPMADLIRERLNVHTAKEMADYASYLTMSAHEQINLGDIIDHASELGNIYAVEILKSAAAETLGLVDNLIRVLGMQDDSEIIVGIWGSNIVQSRTHSEEFEKLIKAKYSQVCVKRPTIQALDGAVKMARELYLDSFRLFTE